MNKIYKVVWNRAKHCYTVASELAKGVTKGATSGRSIRAAAAALAVAAMFTAMPAGMSYAALGTESVSTGGDNPQTVTVVTAENETDVNNIATKSDVSGAVDSLQTNVQQEFGTVNTNVQTLQSSVTELQRTQATLTVDQSAGTATISAKNGAAGANDNTGATVYTTGQTDKLLNDKADKTQLSTMGETLNTKADAANTVADVTQDANAKNTITVTKGGADGTATTITIDNVANATNATNDGNGSNIAETYATAAIDTGSGTVTISTNGQEVGTVYTKGQTDTELAKKADQTALDTTNDNVSDLQTKVGNVKVATDENGVATVTDAEGTSAQVYTKGQTDTELGKKADQTALDTTNDNVSDLQTKVGNVKVATDENGVATVTDAAGTSAQVYTKAQTDTELAKKADQTALNDTNTRVTAVENKTDGISRGTPTSNDNGGSANAKATTISEGTGWQKSSVEVKGNGDGVEIKSGNNMNNVGSSRAVIKYDQGAYFEYNDGGTLKSTTIKGDSTQTGKVEASDSVLVQKDQANQVEINGQGIKVGNASATINKDGFYVGTADGSTSGDFSFKDSKAGMNSDGEIRGAQGQFAVDKNGNVTVGNTTTTTPGEGDNPATTTTTSKFKITAENGNVDTDGNVNAKGDVVASADENNKVTLKGSDGTVTATGKITGNGIDAGTGDLSGANVKATGDVSGNTVTATTTVMAGTGDNQVKLDGTSGAITGKDVTASGTVTGQTITDGTAKLTGGALTDVTSITGKDNKFSADENGNITGVGTVQGKDVKATESISAGATITAGADGENQVKLDGATGAITGKTVKTTGDITSDTTVQGKDLKATEGISAASDAFKVDGTDGSVTTTGNISGKDITATGALNGATLTTTGDATIGGNAAVKGTFSSNDGQISTDTSGNIYVKDSTKSNSTVTITAETGTVDAKILKSGATEINNGNINTTNLTATGTVSGTTLKAGTGGIDSDGDIHSDGNITGKEITATSGMSAAGGAFTVDTNGGVKAAGGKFTVGDDGKITTNAGINAAGGKFTVAEGTGNVTAGDVNAANITGDSITSKGNITASGDITTQNGTISGNKLKGNSLEVENNATVGSLTVNNDADIKGSATVEKDLNVTGAIKGANGAFSVDGTNGSLSASNGNFTVDQSGAVKSNGLDAGTGDIKTTGAVNAGTLSTTGNATIGQDLTVTGQTKTGTLDVTGASTFEGDATFNKDVTVKGKLSTDSLSIEKDANNYTHINDGDVESKKTVTENGIDYKSQSTFDKSGSTITAREDQGTIDSTGISTVGAHEVSQYTGNNADKANATKSATRSMTRDADHTYTITDNVKDTDAGKDNTSTMNEGQSQNIITEGTGDAVKTNTTTKTVEQSENIIQNGTGENAPKSTFQQRVDQLLTRIDETAQKYSVSTKLASSTEDKIVDGDNSTTVTQTAKDITNSAANGTISNTAKTITNESTGDTSNTVGGNLTNKVTGNQEDTVGGNKTTNVTGAVTENYGSQDTTVNGDQKLHVKGSQTNTIDGKQDTTVTGDSSLTAENINNTAKNKITNNAVDIENNVSSTIKDTVKNDAGTNETLKRAEYTEQTLTNPAGTKATYRNGVEEQKATLTKDGKTTTIDTVAGKTNTNITDEQGNVSNDTQTADQKSSSVQDKDQKNQSVMNQTAKVLEGSVTDKDAQQSNTYANKAGSFEQNISDTKDGNKLNAISKTATQTLEQLTNGDNSVTTLKDTGANGPAIGNLVKDKDGNQTYTGQTAKDITNTAEQGTIANKAKTITNESTGDTTNTVGGNLTNKVTGNQEDAVGGNKTTTVTGDSSLSATNISNTASSTITDTVKNAAGSNETVSRAEYTEQTIKDAAGTTSGTYRNGKEEQKATLVKDGKATTIDTIAGQTNTNITDGTNTSNDLQKADQKASSVTDGTNQTVQNQTAKAIEGSVANGPADTATKTNNYANTADGFQQNITDTSEGGNKLNAISKTATQTLEQLINGNNSVTTLKDTGVNGPATGNLVKDADGNQTYTGQTAKDITNTSSNGNITNTAKNGTITNDAKDIANKASNSIKDTVGDNVSREMTTTKITDKVTDGANRSNTESKTAKKNLTKVMNGKAGSSISQTATQVGFDLGDGNGNTQKQTNSVENGVEFENSANNTVITEAPKSTESGFTKTTIKGNTVTTGAATMDWAEVMKDLGVRGNVKVDKNLDVDGNTTLGKTGENTTLTVNSTSTFKENATFEKDVTVNGTTTTKELHVTGASKLDGDVTMGGNATVTKDLSVGGNANVAGDVTAKSFKVGDKTYIDSNGLNANNQKITNVAPGEISATSTDAINGSQLHETNMRVDSIDRKVEKLDNRVDKVGANAAAMANLHPLEFDPDSKWNIAAAVGNYRSETATAVGAFYRPNEDVQLNISTSFGNGENMVGGGVSLRLGHGGNKQRVKDAKDLKAENDELRARVDNLTARMDALLSVINPAMSQEFPDVPQNHWAYEAVSKLAGNGIVEGFEDGKFHGEETMTRYQMAEIIYNALAKGAKAEQKLVEEFKPELQAMAAQKQAGNQK